MVGAAVRPLRCPCAYQRAMPRPVLDPGGASSYARVLAAGTVSRGHRRGDVRGILSCLQKLKSPETNPHPPAQEGNASDSDPMLAAAPARDTVTTAVLPVTVVSLTSYARLAAWALADETGRFLLQ